MSYDKAIPGGSAESFFQSKLQRETIASLRRLEALAELDRPRYQEHDICTVENKSGTRVELGGVLSLDAIPHVTATNTERLFTGPPLFEGIAPTTQTVDRLAIATHPVRADGVGEFWVGGWIAALVDYQEIGHRHVEVVAGALVSAEQGLPMIPTDPGAAGSARPAYVKLEGGAAASTPPAPAVGVVYTAVPDAEIAGAPAFGLGQSMGMGSGTIWENTFAVGPVRIVPQALAGTKDIANPFQTALPGPTAGNRECHYPAIKVSESPEIYQVVGPDFARMLYNYPGAARARSLVLPDAAGTSSEAYEWQQGVC